MESCFCSGVRAKEQIKETLFFRVGLFIHRELLGKVVLRYIVGNRHSDYLY